MSFVYKVTRKSFHMELELPYTEEKDNTTKRYYETAEKAVEACNVCLIQVEREVHQKWDKTFSGGKSCDVFFSGFSVDEANRKWTEMDTIMVLDYKCQYHTLYQIMVQRIPLL